MSWLKFSLICLTVISFSARGASKFTSDECFDASFKTEVEAQTQLFGLLQSNLKIDKNKCLFKITQKRVLETEWLIDVCREPIHMKVTSKGSQTVYKRLGACEGNSEMDFCQSWKELKTLIEDRGLIFAEGQREVLSTDHGQVYCSYLILKKYLDEGKLFSLFDRNINLYNAGETKTSVFNTEKPLPLKVEKDQNSLPLSTPAPVKEIEGQF